MRRGYLLYILPALFLAGCSGLEVRVLPYSPPTFFPTPTPLIYSPTPIILAPPITATFPPILITPSLTLPPPSETITFTSSPQPTFTDTPITPTLIPPTPITPTPTIDNGPTSFAAINTTIIGCNTSIDITHGMGEVTNAYVTISNIGTAELDNVCATLNAEDEGRPHPDKTRCVALLPIGYQVTQKLTVDSTFQKSTSIQVEVTYSLGLLQRIGQDACTNLGIFVPNSQDLGVVKPTP